MLKKSASGVLASLRSSRDWLRHWSVLVPLSDGDSHQRERWQSPSLTAALLDSLFEHPARGEIYRLLERTGISFPMVEGWSDCGAIASHPSFEWATTAPFSSASFSLAISSTS